MIKINKNYIFIILIILFIVGIAGSAYAYTGTGFSHDKKVSDYTSTSLNDILNKYNDTDCKVEAIGVCTKVSDGDTIYVEGVGKVRFVGVNTPEKGVEGSDASKYFVEKLCLNKEVSLDIDDWKHSDKYGRTLAVVIIDGKNLNEMLLKEGLAEVMYIPPSEFYPYNWVNSYTHISSYKSNNTDTSSSSSSDSQSSTAKYVGNSNTYKFHYSNCKWAIKISDKNKITFNSRESAINQGYIPCKVCNP